MDSNQENELFKALGSIQATQTALLDKVSEIKIDIHQSIEEVNKRVDKAEANTKAVAKKASDDLVSHVEKTDQRFEKVETKVTNLRLKVAGAGGAGGLAVLIIAELIKLKAGGG